MKLLMIINFTQKKPVLKVKQTNLRELNEEDLSKIKDHDLLESLIRLFNEEELESLLTQIQELREMLIEQIRKNLDTEKLVKENEKKNRIDNKKIG